MMNLKPYVKTLEGKPVAVFGLGKSGLAAVAALHKAGAKIYAWDDSKAVQKQAAKAGATIKRLNKTLLKTCGNLILSPGIPLHYPEPHEVVKAAREAGCEIIGDIELFYRAKRGLKTLALTGTNGKSTTVTLMQHVLQSCHRKSVLGGNIGAPILGVKLPPQKGGVVVLEMSSFQLDLCPDFEADIAILLNLTPDHIDRHGTMAQYVETKARICNGARDIVICIDDEHTSAIYNTLSSDPVRRIIPISVTKELEYGIYVVGGILIDKTGEEACEVGSINGILTLNGVHNHQNVAATYATMRLLGLEPAEILEALKTYAGLAHRQYPARVINGVSYINDSKATNAEATSKALAAHGNIYWIVGGRKKDGGLQGLENYCHDITHAFLIGETTEEFSEWMEQQSIEYERSHTLKIAMEQAHYMAQKSRGQPGISGVVMLSPACASFDQFESFEKRGECFMALVEALDEEATTE